MKVIKTTKGHRGIKPVLAAMAIMASASVAHGQTGFLEPFTGLTLDSAWVQGGYGAGHIGLTGTEYFMTAIQGGGGNPKLQRFDTAGPVFTWTHEAFFDMNTYFDPGNAGTGSDLKFKQFGADGFMEVVMNSFGNVRLFHNNTTAGSGGNLVQNVPTGAVETDIVGIKLNYNHHNDQIKATWNINGGADQILYQGNGNGGSIGDVITSFVEVEIFKFGAQVEVPFVGIDEWNLNVIPEPTSAALLGLGSLSLLFLRRRR